ncbi:MAG: polymer-forming cytoskeletal protein [Chloroflexota bacterium]
MKRLALILTSLLLLLLLPVGVALAAPPFNNTVVEAGEHINNNIILFDGDLDVAADSVINGDVVLFNGSFTLAGEVNGDVVLFNGNLEAAETAVINGDCVLLNGTINDQSLQGLGCTQAANLPLLFPELPSSLMQTMPTMDGMPRHGGSFLGFFGNLARVAGNSLLMGFLAFVAAALLPEQVSRTTEAIRRKPGASGVIGLLTAVAIPSIIALLLPISLLLTLVCIGLLGFPIMFILAVGLGAGLLLGWIGLGHLLAERIAAMFTLRTSNQPIITAFSTALLTLTLGVLALLPGGFIVSFGGWVLAMVGLGAAALTQFGTRPYPLLRQPRPNADKVTAVLETLPVEETQRLKEK